MTHTRKTRSTGDEPPPCLTPKRKKDSEWRLTDLPALEVARQLTIIEQQVFTEIPLTEYYQARWTKNEAPKIEEASCFSNKLSYWFAWLIVREDKLKMRVTHLTYIITVGKVSLVSPSFSVYHTPKVDLEHEDSQKSKKIAREHHYSILSFIVLTFFSISSTSVTSTH